MSKQSRKPEDYEIYPDSDEEILLSSDLNWIDWLELIKPRINTSVLFPARVVIAIELP